MAFIYYQYFLGRGLLLDSAIQSKLPRGEITSCGIVVSQITTNMFQVLQLQSHHFSSNKIYRIRLITVLAFIRAKKSFSCCFLWTVVCLFPFESWHFPLMSYEFGCPFLYLSLSFSINHPFLSKLMVLFPKFKYTFVPKYASSTIFCLHNC